MESEIQMFNNLLSKDPTPGMKNRVIRNDKLYLVPGWVFDKKDKYVKITYKKLNREFTKAGYNTQIVYDILMLGLTNIEDRPKCPVCGSVRKFYNFTRNYYTTCAKDNCIKASIKSTVTVLWKNSEYRQAQVDSHLEWCSKEENKEKMSKISLDTWSNPEYRKKQVESHKKFAYNNPDKIRAGNHGILKCSKSNKGELIYDSSWEQLFIILCENLDFVTSINRVSFSIQYKYQKEYFMYFPDFDVTLSNGKRLMIELKANWMIEKDKKTPLKLKAGGGLR